MTTNAQSPARRIAGRRRPGPQRGLPTVALARDLLATTRAPEPVSLPPGLRHGGDGR
jgi:hypothetical protein